MNPGTCIPSAVRHAGLSDVGRVRTVNEDRWYADPHLGLYLVADGIGGAWGGELAAEIVVEVLPPLIRERLRKAVEPSGDHAARAVHGALAELNERLRQQTLGRPGLEGMGATVALVLVQSRRAVVAHLGDSRIYLVRGERLERLTRDHTIAQLLVESGDIGVEEAAVHPGYCQLTRFLGMVGQILPEFCEVEFQPADRLLLCSDGLTAMLDDDTLLGILLSNEPPDAICRCLVCGANAAGGKDNITVLVITCDVLPPLADTVPRSTLVSDERN